MSQIRTKSLQDHMLLFVGDSHLRSIWIQRERPALKRYPEALLQNPFFGVPVEVIYLPNLRKKQQSLPDFLVVLTERLEFALGQLTTSVLRNRNRSKVRLHVVFSVGGNNHNIVGLVQRGCSFDFSIPHERLELDRQAQPIPYQAMFSVLQEVSAFNFRAMSIVKQLVTSFVQNRIELQFFHMEFPPPIEDDTFLTQSLQEWYGALRPEDTLSRPLLRYKLWRTYCNVYNHFCKKQGIRILHTPTATTRGGKYLQPAYYGHNATHANWGYSQQVIAELFQRHLESS